MIIIPAIDIIDGRCVRLQQGDFATEKVYEPSVAALASSYASAGAEYLHLVDLDAARLRPHNRALIAQIAAETELSIQVGGGIRSREDVDSLLEAGVDHLIIGSMAQQAPAMVMGWVTEYGPETIIIGADAKNGYIATEGWLESTDDSLDTLVEGYSLEGARRYLITDIARDGMLCGPAVELYRSLLKVHTDIEVIASGGVSSLADIDALASAGLYAVVVGKALLEGRFSAYDLFGR